MRVLRADNSHHLASNDWTDELLIWNKAEENCRGLSRGRMEEWRKPQDKKEGI